MDGSSVLNIIFYLLPYSLEETYKGANFYLQASID